MAYWIISSQHVRPTKQAETRASRYSHLTLVYAAFGLVLLPLGRVEFLGWHLWPNSPPVFFIGAGILLVGFCFAVWARLHLGQYWSGTVTLKEGHRLIRTGPYALVRHPIYTGFTLGLLGTAILVGQLRGLLGVILLLIAYFRKLRQEERWLTEAFGDEYREYQAEVKTLVPFVI